MSKAKDVAETLQANVAEISAITARPSGQTERNPPSTGSTASDFTPSSESRHCNAVRHFFGQRKPLKRMTNHHRLALLGIAPGDRRKLGQRDRRRHAIDPDAMRPQLLGEHPAGPLEPRLRGRIGQVILKAAMPGNGSNVDDRATPTRLDAPPRKLLAR